FSHSVLLSFQVPGAAARCIALNVECILGGNGSGIRAIRSFEEVPKNRSCHRILGTLNGVSLGGELCRHQILVSITRDSGLGRSTDSSNPTLSNRDTRPGMTENGSMITGGMSCARPLGVGGAQESVCPPDFARSVEALLAQLRIKLGFPAEIFSQA